MHFDGVKVEGKLEETAVSIVVQAGMCIAGMPTCPHCNSNAAVIAWDIRWRNIRDVEQDGKLVLVVLACHRFRCKLCKKTFTPPLRFLERGRVRRTARLTKKTERLANERQTTSDVAVATGLSRRTVQSIASEAAKEQPTPQDVLRQATEAEDAAW